LVIGKILLIHVDESIIKDGKINYDLYHPIGRLGGMDYARTRDRFTMVRKKYTDSQG
jgi:flavin reductase (DIM6/NTAB) family NADH-FMN oxidoreductase RutF